MEPQDPTENPFAPEYPHIQEWVMEAEAKLEELNQEMARTGVAPRLILGPLNPMGATPAVQVRRSRADIQHEKDEKKSTVYKRVEKETEKAEPQLKKRMQDIAFGRIYREEIELIRLANLGLASPTASWSVNEIQVKAMAFAKASRDKQRARPPQTQIPERAERIVVMPSEPADTALSPPAETALPEQGQSEAYTEVSQDTPREPEQTLDIDPEL